MELYQTSKEITVEITSMTDEELTAHLNLVLREQERRQRLASIPITVTQLAEQFREGGGEQATLIAAIA